MRLTVTGTFCFWSRTLLKIQRKGLNMKRWFFSFEGALTLKHTDTVRHADMDTELPGFKKKKRHIHFVLSDILGQDLFMSKVNNFFPDAKVSCWENIVLKFSLSFCFFFHWRRWQKKTVWFSQTIRVRLVCFWAGFSVLMILIQCENVWKMNLGKKRSQYGKIVFMLNAAYLCLMFTFCGVVEIHLQLYSHSSQPTSVSHVESYKNWQKSSNSVREISGNVKNYNIFPCNKLSPLTFNRNKFVLWNTQSVCPLLVLILLCSIQIWRESDAKFPLELEFVFVGRWK